MKKSTSFHELKSQAVRAHDKWQEVHRTGDCTGEEYETLQADYEKARNLLVGAIATIPLSDLALGATTSDGRLVTFNLSAQRERHWQLTRFGLDDLPAADSLYSSDLRGLVEFLAEIDLSTLDDLDGRFKHPANPLSVPEDDSALLDVDALRRLAKNAVRAIRDRSAKERASGAEQISERTLHKNWEDSHRASAIGSFIALLEQAPPRVARSLSLDHGCEDATAEQRSSLQGLPMWDKTGCLSLREASESFHTSAQATYSEYLVAHGLRAIDLSLLGDLAGYDSPVERRRIASLAQAIQLNGEIEPVFAALDSDGDLWLVEGQHRARAFVLLGIDTIPARVMVELSSPKLEVEVADDPASVTRRAVAAMKMIEEGGGVRPPRQSTSIRR